MELSRDWFTQVEPRLIRREDGGWLAVTPPGAPLPLGFAAWTAEDARQAFVRGLREWGALLDEPLQNAVMALK
jgi:hypothetical protein